MNAISDRLQSDSIPAIRSVHNLVLNEKHRKKNEGKTSSESKLTIS